MEFLTSIIGPLLVEAVLPAVGTLAMTAIGFLALRYRALTGVEMDAKFKQSLHGALMNALAGVLHEFPSLSDDAAVEKAIKRAQKSNPGTFKHFGLDLASPILMNLAMGLLERLRPRLGPIGNALGDTLEEQVAKYPPGSEALRQSARAAEERAAAARLGAARAYPPKE